MPLLTRAEDRAGRRFELSRADTDDHAEARRRAGRAAVLLAAIDTTGAWIGSRVTVHEAHTGRLVFVARIVRGKGVPRV
jgi:hypothetical protein